MLSIRGISEPPLMRWIVDVHSWCCFFLRVGKRTVHSRCIQFLQNGRGKGITWQPKGGGVHPKQKGGRDGRRPRKLPTTQPIECTNWNGRTHYSKYKTNKTALTKCIWQVLLQLKLVWWEIACSQGETDTTTMGCRYRYSHDVMCTAKK